MVAVGDKIPSATLNYMKDGEVKEITTEELTAGKKVVIFALPGAFTPTCSKSHLPGFVENQEQLKAKGIDTVVCLSVNDAFVMDAWGKGIGVGDKVLMCADGNADFTKAMGLSLDLSGFGMGVRSNRYAAVIDNGVIKSLNVEPSAGGLTCSSAKSVLDGLEL